MYIEFKAEKTHQVFNILPILHIEWDIDEKWDWAIVIGWLRWLMGVRFYTRCQCKHSSWNRDAGCFVCDDCGERI